MAAGWARWARRLGALLVLVASVLILPGPATSARADVASGTTPAPGAPVSYVMAPAPIAAAGSLGPGQSVVVDLTVLDGSAAPVPDAVAYLWFSSTAAAPGSASADGMALTGTPQPFTASQNGVIAIQYSASSPQCSAGGTCIPAGFPSTGSDRIQADDTAGGAGNGGAAGAAGITATDSYSYGAPAGADRYSFSPDPVAGPGGLSPGQSVPVTLSVTTAAGVPEPDTTVYVSLGGDGLGALAPSASGPGGCLASSISTPAVECFTDPTGSVGLTYTSAGGNGTAPPGTGRDVITAANQATGPSETTGDPYDYAPPTYSWSSQVAPSGSLGSDQAESVVLTVTDSRGAPVPDCPVYLLIGARSPQAVIGSAAATGAVPSPADPTGSPELSGTATPFQADAAGRIVIIYSTPDSPPAQGLDALVAQNRPSSPTAEVYDGYSYGPAAFSFGPDPVAPGASLAAGHKVTVHLTVTGTGTYLSFHGAPGGGSASVNGQVLSATPAAFTPSGGSLDVVYTAPTPLPKSGSDRIVAQDSASAPGHVASAIYSFTAGTGAGGSGNGAGYWEVAGDGGLFSFGSARFHGSEGGVHLAAPIVGLAATPDGAGYWMVAADGGIFTFGDAGFYGSEGGTHLAAPIVAMAATPDGAGYWLVAADGGIFNFGDARFFGSAGGSHLSAPVIGLAATPDGGGYWLAGHDGSVLAFGDAPDRGSEAGSALAAPVVGIAATATGLGYWLVAADGGIFSFGDAAWFGSTGGERLNSPIVGMEAVSNSAGYWLVAGDGGVFSFGDAPFAGSEGGIRLNSPVKGLAAT